MENNNSDYNDPEIQEVVEDVIGSQKQLTLVDFARDSKLYTSHPECRVDMEKTVLALAEKIADGVDPNHTSSPYLSKYERTAVLAFRASQLQKGFPPFIVVPEHVTDVYEIAKMELAQKKCPFILKRTMPDGRAEYVRAKDLLFRMTD